MIKQLFTGLLLAATLAACTQPEDVPQAAKDDFTSRFAKAESVNWQQDDERYQAAFTLDGVAYEATYTPQGEWLRTQGEIRFPEVPEAVREALFSKYANYKGRAAKDVEIIETPKGTFYGVALEEGRFESEVYFDAEGREVAFNEELENIDSQY